MTEMVLRGGHNDHVVLTEVLTDPQALTPRMSRLIKRVVVDATAVVRQPAFAQAAYAAGTQLLVDPQTHFLTSTQDPTDSWASLPFATARAITPEELLDPRTRAELIEAVVEFELDHGATGIIPPYLHLSDFSVAAEVQRLLIIDTAAHLDDLGLRMPLFPILSVDQRAVSVKAENWATGLGNLITVAVDYAGGPFALGLATTNGPNRSNLHTATRIWRRAARLGSFIAWHAGETGLLAVTMGAEGYEVGMCRAERYNVRSQQRGRRGTPTSGPRFVGAYVESIGRTLNRKTAEELSTVRGVHQADLSCLDPSCCPQGFASTLGSVGRRQHAVRSRLRDLDELDGIATRRWRLRHLMVRAQNATASARRIRAAANNRHLKIGANPEELEAMELVTRNLQATAAVRGSVA